MTFSASWYTQHPQEVEESDPSILESLPFDKFKSIVSKAAKSNTDLHFAAIGRADSGSWQIAHPEYLQTAKNNKLMNHWLTSKGLFEHATYADFQAAYEALAADGLLDIDQAELAKQQDQRGNRTFKGQISGLTFDSIDSMIAQERQAALRTVPEPTEEEKAFDSLPLEQQQTLLRQGERETQLEANGLKTQKNGDAWITLNPWYVDSKRNGQLMKMQLSANGVTDRDASIHDFDVAGKQLRQAGLLSVSKANVDKERAAEIAQLASGSVDTTTEQEMYNLPLDELRRRAFGIF